MTAGSAKTMDGAPARAAPDGFPDRAPAVAGAAFARATPTRPSADSTSASASASAAAGLPRRVLIVSDAWTPQVNGVVRTYENIAHVLRAEGCDVQVIGPDAFATVALPGYAEIPLALHPGPRLAAMIDAFAPQAIHIAVEGPLGWAARRHCLRRGLPFSTAFHTNFPAYAALRAPRPLAAGVERLAASLIRGFHAPARLTYVATPSVEAQLRAWGFAGRMERLSRGVDCETFHPGRPARPPGTPPVLLYVGRVAPEKNLDAFLGLPAEALGPELAGARKVVVGDGPQLAALRRRHPGVEFRGTLTGTALAEAYRGADVFVFPSRTDTFGIVLIEAMASGLPIAAHPAPGPRDIVTGPGLGALDDDLGRAIRRAFAAPWTPQERHRHARATYSWEAVARTFLRHSAEMDR